MSCLKLFFEMNEWCQKHHAKHADISRRYDIYEEQLRADVKKTKVEGQGLEDAEDSQMVEG